MGKNLKGKECGKGIYQRKDLIVTSPDMTVDKWFTYWIENIVCDLAPNTIRNYQERYKWNIQPVFGAMCIADVKPMHCKAVLNHTYATRAIERGVQPKVLQQLLGHASIKTTMDRYVHVTDESLVNAIRQFQQVTPPVSKKGVKGRTRNLTKGRNP